MITLRILTATLLLALPATAAPILSPSTTTYGGIVDGVNFVTGASTAVFSPPSNGWPAGQEPTEAVDGVIGPGSKYLNLNITNTALIFSGTIARVADRLELWVAEDEVGRDPATYAIYGTNVSVPALTSGGSTFALSNFVQLGVGSLALPATRDSVADGVGNSQVIHFPNTTAYASYLVVFPSVKGPAANSMQISEVQLYDSGIIGADSFDYADGAIAGKNGGQLWNYKNFAPTGYSGAASTWDNISAAPAVSNGRLITLNSSAKREYNGALESDGAVNDPASGPSSVAKSVYYKVSLTTGATVPDFIAMSSYDFGTEQLFFGKRNGQANFGLEVLGGATAATSTPVAANSPYTLVAKVDYVADRISFFVNPNLAASEPAPTAFVTYTGTNWSTAVRLSSGNGGSVAWDDLVVTTDWNSLAPIVVTTLADEDDGSLGGGAGVSLREAVKYAPAGRAVTFASGFSRGTITLTHADGELFIPQAVTIDATGLPGGLTVSGNNASRHFSVQTGKSLTLRGITLIAGSRAIIGGEGGSIYASGQLHAERCTFAENRANQNGGAIYNSGIAILSQCTFSKNSISTSGGAIHNSGTLTLSHCTLSGNSSAIVGGAFTNAGTLTMNNTIAAGNSAPNGPDVFIFSIISATGVNLLGNVTGSGLMAGVSVLVGDPKLSPLGYFGGPVQTMHPLIGSPAIDAIVTTNPGGTDARGFSRFQDGDTASVGAQLDIGAVEAGPITLVSHAADSLASTTLRTRINNAAGIPGARIGFLAGSLGSPATVTLGGTELSIPATANGLFIDASNLSGPVTISGNNASRVFNIASGATVAMHSLRITDGRGPTSGFTLGDNSGGGIINYGNCTVIFCTVSGNTVTSIGGGLSNLNGTCIVYSSTLSENASPIGGGGIYNFGTCTVISSTITGHSVNEGGGIYNDRLCTVNASTISGNSATSFGGGIFNLGTFHLSTSIVAGNTAPNDTNFRGTLTSNINNLTSGDPLLAPLGDYGGPTLTMPPLPGSPAINAAIGSTRLTDQRGFPIVGTADIGAAEYQGTSDLHLFWNTDWDSDGNAFGVEHALGTDAALADAANTRNLTGPTFTPLGQASLTFGRNTSATPGTISIVKRSTDLITFTEVFRITGNSPVPAVGISAIVNTDSITILDSNPPPGKAFYRIEAVSP